MIKIIFFIALLLPHMSMAEAIERDPFSPFMWEKPAAVGVAAPTNGLNTTPLTKLPLSSYKLIGLIVSPNDSIALLKSRDKREYFVNVGDSVGNEGGIIDLISSDGMTVDINGKLVDLTVSNRFDIQDESN